MFTLIAIFGPPALVWLGIRWAKRKAQRELAQLAYDIDLARCTVERDKQLAA